MRLFRVFSHIIINNISSNCKIIQDKGGKKQETKMHVFFPSLKCLVANVTMYWRLVFVTFNVNETIQQLCCSLKMNTPCQILR